MTAATAWQMSSRLAAGSTSCHQLQASRSWPRTDRQDEHGIFAAMSWRRGSRHPALQEPVDSVCEQIQFVHPPDLGGERRSQEIGDITNSFTNTYQLSVEETRLGFPPEEIAGVQIMVNEGMCTSRKKLHGLTALAGIAQSGSMQCSRNGVACMG